MKLSNLQKKYMQFFEDEQLCNWSLEYGETRASLPYSKHNDRFRNQITPHASKLTKRLYMRPTEKTGITCVDPFRHRTVRSVNPCTDNVGMNVYVELNGVPCMFVFYNYSKLDMIMHLKHRRELDENVDSIIFDWDSFSTERNILKELSPKAMNYVDPTEEQKFQYSLVHPDFDLFQNAYFVMKEIRKLKIQNGGTCTIQQLHRIIQNIPNKD